MKTQEAIFNDIIKVGKQTERLSHFVQNDIKQMLEQKSINAQHLSEAIFESRESFDEVIIKLQTLKKEVDVHLSSILEKFGEPKPIDKKTIAEKLIAYLETQQVGNFIHVLREAGVSEEDARRLCRN